MTQKVLCPNGGHSSVQRVLAIVAQGTTTTEVPVERDLDAWRDQPRYRYETTREATSTTRLATLLQPPASLAAHIKPVPPPETTITPFKPYITTKYSKGFIIGLILTGIFAFYLWAVIVDPNPQVSLESKYIAGFIAVLLIGASIALMWFSRRKNRRVELPLTPYQEQLKAQRYAEAEAAYRQYMQRVAAQKLANERYSRIYYCSTCYSIFDPTDPHHRTAQPEELERYLYAS